MDLVQPTPIDPRPAIAAGLAGDLPRSHLHALTVDVEDWTTGIPIDRCRPGSSDRRLRSTLELLLGMLDRSGARGTFFWHGELAREFPDLVRAVVGAGHRIGCLGGSRSFVHETPPAVLRQRVSDARKLLEDLIGARVLSFRTPLLSISRETTFVLDMLAELGFTIDSSLLPTWSRRRGIPGFSDRIRKARRRTGSLWLAPITVRKVLGFPMPVSGGACFRSYPYALTRASFHWIERRERPVVFRLHPRELDPGPLRRSFDIPCGPSHRAGPPPCGDKLRRLLAEFRFEPLEETVERLRRAPPGSRASGGGSARGTEGRCGSARIWDHGMERRAAAHSRVLADRSREPAVLLDIGTRDGRVLHRVSRELDSALAVGLDLETDRFPRLADVSMRLVQGDGQAIPLRDASVDVILCTSTFKHVWDAEVLLAECARVLAPGGLLSLVDVTPGGTRLAIAGGRLQAGTVRRMPDLDGLCSLLTRSGFEVEHRERFMALPFALPGTEALEAFLRRRGLDGRMFYQMVCARVAGDARRGVRAESGV